MDSESGSDVDSLNRTAASDSRSGWIAFEEVLEEERDAIEDAFEQRAPDGKCSGTPFALAFSGGGMRAAAFQCGVLWRLARMNLLKDVELLTAVSGGGYIASAFASHCLAEGCPKQGQVKEWYQRVVAKTVVRMQENTGNFVRDFDRSGCCVPNEVRGLAPTPRILDAPILLVTLAITMLVNPAFAIICYAIPIVVITDAFFGQEFRDAFCSRDHVSHLVRKFILTSPAFLRLAWITLCGFIGLMASLVLTPKDPRKGKELKGKRVEHGMCFLLLHGVKAFLTRFTGFLIIYIIFLICVLYSQIAAFSEQWGEHGSDQLINAYCQPNQPGHCLPNCLPKVTFYSLAALLALFVAAIVVMPYFGSGLVIDVACLAGPSFVFIFLMRFAQYRIFGELTSQDLIWGDDFDMDSWNLWVKAAMLAAVILLPFYNSIRGILNYYYQTCLVYNFFAEGTDKPMVKLLENPYIPFLLVTGTSSDYQAPIMGDKESISEVSFSPLHCGSKGVGYIVQPNYRSLGTCTALTAAGCTDAVALTLSKLMAMRFLLETLNLSWGQYIIFSEKSTEEAVGEHWVKMTNRLPYAVQAETIRFMDRMPSTIAVTVIWFLAFWGFRTGEIWYYQVAMMLFAIVVSLCFLPTGCWLSDEVTQSPWLRQIPQFTGYHYRGDHPPPMLYITDGGCRDCTTLRQLVLRRQERILMALAASDPADDLGVLKTAIDIIRDMELASFFDPKDPRRDLRLMFKEYKEDRSIMFLHIGIRYDKTEKEDAKIGHLYIVKNRLPLDQESHPVEPHLTQQEMCGECGRGEGPTQPDVKAFDPETWGDMTTDKLGSLCCCDGMHTNGICGNCGPAFPHGSFANFMYMTPMWCNSLARLGYDISEQAVTAASKPGPQSASWEEAVQRQYPAEYQY